MQIERLNIYSRKAPHIFRLFHFIGDLIKIQISNFYIIFPVRKLLKDTKNIRKYSTNYWNKNII